MNKQAQSGVRTGSLSPKIPRRILTPAEMQAKEAKRHDELRAFADKHGWAKKPASTREECLQRSFLITHRGFLASLDVHPV